MSSTDLSPPCNVDAHRALAGLDPSRGVHRILAGERRLNVERREAALGQRRRRHLDEDALLLQPQQVDLGDAGNAQQDVARVLGEVLELGIAVALAGDGVKRDVGVAELVVEEGPDHALGQRLANVADLLARLIEGVLDGLAAHRALEVDEDVGEAGPRVGAHEIEARRFLQLALDLVDHLVLHFLGRGAGPQHLHHHDAEGEVGVLLLADAQQREGAGGEQQHEQEAVKLPWSMAQRDRLKPLVDVLTWCQISRTWRNAPCRHTRLADASLVRPLRVACVCSLARQAHAHAVAQELHARGHHHVAGLQSAGDPHAVLGDSADA